MSTATPQLVEQLAARLMQKGWMLATAESCTGGMIASACTDLAGSSNWFDRGFVTYSNAAKQDMLGVPETLIDSHGAVSEPVARAMASGAVARSLARCSVAVTGVAGPGGGSGTKPVGTVWFGWHLEEDATGPQTHAECLRFDGDRAQVRQATVQHALQRLLQLIS